MIGRIGYIVYARYSSMVYIMGVEGVTISELSGSMF